MLGSVIALAILSVPSCTASPSQIPLAPQDHSQGYKFDPLLHLPGTSPYSDAIGFGLEHKAPVGCKVTAVSYLVRHGAIYANDEEYDAFIRPFIWKHEQHRGAWRGSLAFLNNWQSPILEHKLEDLTPSGADDAKLVGGHIAKRYKEIIATTQRVVTDKKARCFDTAKSFIRDFPNHDKIEIVKLKKPKDGSIDPTIPHKTCSAFSKSPGDIEQAAFNSQYTAAIRARLGSDAPFNLSDDDIVAMQSICGYESAIQGKQSPFCSVFTDDEWMAYEYSWDLKYAYMVGPLNKLSPYLGFPWLKAQSELFQHINDTHSTPGAGWPDAQRVFLYFTHREVAPFVATALGIFNSSFEAEAKSFPTDHIVWTRAWKMSDLIPFLGHVGLEKITCNQRPAAMNGAVGDAEDAQAEKYGRQYIRVIANTAPRPIPACQDGPGASCPFEKFQDIISTGAKTFADYKRACHNS